MPVVGSRMGMDLIIANLDVVRETIARAAERSGRSPDAVTLIAVSKTVQVGRILAAMEAGITNFGENRVQEARAKFAGRGSGLAEGKAPRDGINLHMIGSLQRNKARPAAALFDCVQSVDRIELVDALDKASAQEREGQPLPVLLEANLTGEPSKSGVSPEKLPALADSLAGCRHLRGVGLMTIARMGANEAELRHTFATTRHMLEDLTQSYPGDWAHLSMGMSDDYQYAIEEGATMVRLGRAIFGERTRKT